MKLDVRGGYEEATTRRALSVRQLAALNSPLDAAWRVPGKMKLSVPARFPACRLVHCGADPVLRPDMVA